MDFFDAVNNRYSYRGEFTDAPVPEEDIRKMLTAAVKAPSGLNAQTTNFIAVTDPALRKRLADIFPHAGLATAPLIIVAASVRKEMYKGDAFEIEDYAAAVENLCLAVTALGYATVWADGQTREGDRQQLIGKLLNVPAGWTVRTVLPVGVPREPGKQKEKLPFELRVGFNSFPDA